MRFMLHEFEVNVDSDDKLVSKKHPNAVDCTYNNTSYKCMATIISTIYSILG